MDTLISAAAITLAAAVTVALWTFRIALASRGRRVLSASIAAFEAILFVLIFTGLVTNLGDPIRLGAYALGVAAGTWFGLMADERLSSGQSEVRLIVPGRGTHLVEVLHGAGWPATSTPALGPSGPATSVFVAVDDRRVAELLALADSLESSAFVTVGRLRQTRAVPLPAGFVQVGQRSWASRGASQPAGAAPLVPVLNRTTAVVEPRGVDPGIATRDLRLASAELGETLADVPDPTDLVARAIAGWLSDVAAAVGRGPQDLDPTPVLLARAHAVVGRALLSTERVPEAAELAARARQLTDVLRRATRGG